MAINRRKGWIRLGVVLSLAWLLGVLVFSIYEHYAAKSYFAASLKEIIGKYGRDVEARYQTLLTDCSGEESAIACSPRWINLALLVLGPVLGCWVLAIVLTYAALWIRAGFRGHDC